MGQRQQKEAEILITKTASLFVCCDIIFTVRNTHSMVCSSSKDTFWKGNNFLRDHISVNVESTLLLIKLKYYYYYVTNCSRVHVTKGLHNNCIVLLKPAQNPHYRTICIFYGFCFTQQQTRTIYFLKKKVTLLFR